MSASAPARLSRRALLSILGATGEVAALGRTPYGGRLRLQAPWPLGRLDPHVDDSGASALLAPATFDTLYSLDGNGGPYPTLAARLPTTEGGAVRLSLRPNLKSARGKKLSGADLLFSLARARELGAHALLANLGSMRTDPAAPYDVLLGGAEPGALAQALTSPLTALVPRGFSARAPDGTGAFRADFSADGLLLSRNVNAARGAAFLDAIELSQAVDLSGLLRDFEAGTSDVAWFGSGLYRAGKDAVPFETAPYGFAVLRSGALARGWGAPGILQALLDAIAPDRLAHFGLTGLSHEPSSARWGGPPVAILVESASAQLLSIAKALAGALSSPGHELSVVALADGQLERTRESGNFALMVDFVRPLGPSARERELSLRSAVSRELAQKPPLVAPAAAREIARSLPLGVIGELSLFGARRAAVGGLDSLQFGSIFRRDL